MRFLRKIVFKAFVYSKRIGLSIFNFLIKNKKIVLWICVPSVLMIMWELGKWIFERLKQEESCGKQSLPQSVELRKELEVS